jgi:hypothetical protein
MSRAEVPERTALTFQSPRKVRQDESDISNRVCICFLFRATWYGSSGSLNVSRVVPLAFAVAMLELVAVEAELIRGTNSTPVGTVSAC